LTQVNEAGTGTCQSGRRGGTAAWQVEGKMSLAKLLAVIDGGSGSEAAVTAALDLGQRFSARVELLHVEIDPETAVPMVGEGMSGAAVEQLVESLRAEAERRRTAARDLYEKHCVAAGLNVVEPHAVSGPGAFAVCFRSMVGREVDEVLHFGRLSDLTVIARPGAEEEGGLTTAFDAALFDSGRPLLLVPTVPAAALGTTVAIAWDRSREAALAVTTALPLLSAAKKVVILTAREPDSEAEPSELAAYLALHGVASRTWAFTPGPGTLGEALLEEAGKAEADMLVMGAYGHSRLREMVLGGVTRSILAHADIPVFLMH
jgi:nucleotide-binding universal stress UspA family protein